MTGNETVEVCYDEELKQRATLFFRLFRIGSKEVWIPKSQIWSESGPSKTFEIPEWLAYEKGLL